MGMDTLRTDNWSNAHFAVNDQLANLLNAMRDLGLNPSLHIMYDREEHHIALEAPFLAQYPSLQGPYEAYLDACRRRDEAVVQIQNLPKLDIGFRAE